MDLPILDSNLQLIRHKSNVQPTELPGWCKNKKIDDKMNVRFDDAGVVGVLSTALLTPGRNAEPVKSVDGPGNGLTSNSGSTTLLLPGVFTGGFLGVWNRHSTFKSSLSQKKVKQTISKNLNYHLYDYSQSGSVCINIKIPYANSVLHSSLTQYSC